LPPAVPWLVERAARSPPLNGRSFFRLGGASISARGCRSMRAQLTLPPVRTGPPLAREPSASPRNRDDRKAQFRNFHRSVVITPPYGRSHTLRIDRRDRPRTDSR
jgi:hypothetical protein